MEDRNRIDIYTKINNAIKLGIIGYFVMTFLPQIVINMIQEGPIAGVIAYFSNPALVTFLSITVIYTAIALNDHRFNVSIYTKFRGNLYFIVLLVNLIMVAGATGPYSYWYLAMIGFAVAIFSLTTFDFVFTLALTTISMIVNLSYFDANQVTYLAYFTTAGGMLVISIAFRRAIQQIIEDLVVSIATAEEAMGKQGHLIDGIRQASTEIAGNVAHLFGSSNQLNEAIENTVFSTHEIAEATLAETEQINEGVASLDKLASSTNTILDHIGHWKINLENRETENVKEYETAVALEETIQQSNQLNEHVMGTITNMTREFDRIVGAVEKITGIANQTNLLALNASIESARAGEAGRGFAVVAEEIRKLAEETSTTSEEINNLIVSMSAEVESAGEVNVRIIDQSKETREISLKTKDSIVRTQPLSVKPVKN